MPVHDENGNTLSWHSYGISDAGRIRKDNEDSMLERPEAGMWAVADGMGGHAAGDVASQMVVNSLKKINAEVPLNLFIDDIENKLLHVNNRLLHKGTKKKKQTTIGSTVTIMLTYEKYCIYLWAGDSRLYRLRKGTLRQMTTDHSQVEEYVERGLIDRDEVANHPCSNMITRAVGATRKFFLDIDMQEMQQGDRYLLCSDGLVKHIVDFELEKMLQKDPLKETCENLIKLTLSRGAEDNVTIIVIDIGQL